MHHCMLMSITQRRIRSGASYIIKKPCIVFKRGRTYSPPSSPHVCLFKWRLQIWTRCLIGRKHLSRVCMCFLEVSGTKGLSSSSQTKVGATSPPYFLDLRVSTIPKFCTVHTKFLAIIEALNYYLPSYHEPHPTEACQHPFVNLPQFIYSMT